MYEYTTFERSTSSVNYDIYSRIEQQSISNLISLPGINNLCTNSQPLTSSLTNYLLSNEYVGSNPYIAGFRQLHQDSISPGAIYPNSQENQLWTTTGADASECPFNSSAKTKEIWRPFSPTPSTKLWPMSEPCPLWNPLQSNELWTFEKYAGSGAIVEPCLISPSSVKIEPSKTSLFKPFKRKSYACSHCSLTYSNNAQLISHMRVHTGIKPYTCEYPNCSKSFARMEELTRHRRIHSGYKPHLCSACGKCFGRKDHLSKHQKTHLQVSEKKVYACCVPGCGHRYTRSDALTRHKSSAHTHPKTQANGKSSASNGTRNDFTAF